MAKKYKKSRDNAMRKILGLPQDSLFVLLEKATKTNETRKLARSAKTGEFVSFEYAKRHPSTTVVETVKC